MKYILSVLTFLIISQASFSQSDSSEITKAAQTKKDIKAYADFQKNEDSYKQMQEYLDATKASELGDYSKAIELMKVAAAKGNPVAAYTIGSMYEDGKGVPGNQDEAIKWYYRAADNGNMNALYALSKIFDIPGDNVGVHNYRFNALQRCANVGLEKCYSPLAFDYEWGEGVEIDYAQAVYWYKKSAEKGNYHAMESTAKLYSRGGHELSQSKECAFKWYMKAATANIYDGKSFPGSKKAMYILYIMYNEGDGVEKNEAEAIKWLLKLVGIAETQNLDEFEWIGEALYDLGNAYYTGTAVPQNYSEALKWFTLGAKIKYLPEPKVWLNVHCMEKLATMYRKGQGVKKDLKMAEKWQRDADSW